MTALPTIIPVLVAMFPVDGLECTFDSASIDGRSAFDSVLTARADPLNGHPELAMLHLGGEDPQLALIRQEGVWLSLRTDPDEDHNQRVTILDFAISGPSEGLAVLIVSEPGTATEMVSRNGTCTAVAERR
ncbi:hypothetical protein [Meridianimarinicoccus aquatilis]|uniref:Uncharacterized protein n=1 Tax=Meridianimarinicoccus aquatilis TaxID=2552766 RepID=A0A4R6AWE3_9RHOB|nr:hypothetical protein [Fluviibacterium aquatile]QIE42594.1 hypothetical protein G5B39_12020 [Rhodobacteraceae bacterium SC52]TDL87954.1 hypothetical protein E2L05_10130 [Fluviibacterium aquatile]